ncbi:Nif3-like dinuclear metal center hexameric protein [Comamonas sp. 4034]|uniref:Nif3-like dinuclear metal center hexameric protein n=1 Tax=Comamonas sp. 4034 TaxID=3156455 RepID=UPI003D2571D4
MTTTRQDMLQAFNTLLQPERFKDYGPNGLQVEGKTEIRKLVSGVTASRALIDAAIAAGADAIFVHHGLFWRGYDGRITGWMKQRIERLIKHDINLFAYHLPLDAHPELGNNAQLGVRLGWQADGRFGEQDLGFIGSIPEASAQQIAAQIQQALGRSVTLATSDDHRPIRRMAWCTGGAQGFFEAAIAAGADGFLTGEISEPQAHLARETGVSFFAGGHHATERYGAPAAAALVAQQLGIAHEFIDIDNPA